MFGFVVQPILALWAEEAKPHMFDGREQFTARASSSTIRFFVVGLPENARNHAAVMNDLLPGKVQSAVVASSNGSFRPFDDVQLWLL